MLMDVAVKAAIMEALTIWRANWMDVILHYG